MAECLGVAAVITEAAEGEEGCLYPKGLRQPLSVA